MTNEPASESKLERTYALLRDRIHDGTYPPLARLNIDALARELEVSPIPVREALRRLEAEGWVQFRRNAGAIVAPVDATMWGPAMVCLAILEGAGTAQAAPFLRKTDLAKLRTTTERMDAAAAKADPLEFSRLNRFFHDTILSRCPNHYLVDMIAQTNAKLDRLRQTMFVYLPERSGEAVKEHGELLTLLDAGDQEKIEAYARWHKLQTVEAYQAIHKAAARRNGDVGAAVNGRRRPAPVRHEELTPPGERAPGPPARASETSARDERARRARSPGLAALARRPPRTAQ